MYPGLEIIKIIKFVTFKCKNYYFNFSRALYLCDGLEGLLSAVLNSVSGTEVTRPGISCLGCCDLLSTKLVVIEDEILRGLSVEGMISGIITPVRAPGLG